MLPTSETASPPLKSETQTGVGIIYGKTPQTSFCAGETLVTAWLKTEGIILTKRNAEWDTDPLSRIVTD